MTKRQVKQYSVVPSPVPKSRVLILEVVLPPGLTIEDDAYSGCTSVVMLDELLERLREYGAAEVVDRFYVSTGFDDTCRVLTSRKRDL